MLFPLALVPQLSQPVACQVQSQLASLVEDATRWLVFFEYDTLGTHTHTHKWLNLSHTIVSYSGLILPIEY